MAHQEPGRIHPLRWVVLGAAAALVAAASAGAAPPAPCNSTPQITDPSGDGHHASSDVLAAWFSEASGHLQAVIQVRAGTWVAEHGDAQVNGSGFAFVFTVAGQVRFVRATAPGPDHPQDAVIYDYGTYTGAGGFVSVGPTTGTVEAMTGGTVTIDVPAATGATLVNPFVLTYDGINGGVPDWVDHAPGGIAPDDPSYGADYVVGSCSPAPPATGSPAPITAVQLSAPARVTGERVVTVTGKVLPARGGVPVTLTRSARTPVVSRLTSAADGTFSARVRLGETTRLRAVAANIGSEELTVRMFTTVKVTVTRRHDGSAVIAGRVDPKLPGRVLWLRTNAVAPSATTTTRSGTFRLRIKHPRRGRYQAVVIPSGDRAERATSKAGAIR